ncbi:hypothetical protein F7725_028758 [Dissostichus mawsoni]|uniref:Uncharacterized protein n=1 Tax=Dissostichus mawsoni TaxID=36200 RepID=A0A7J5XGW0_DISMA|nr:hypothetical protein F7725_028758 [Dissostichus mawsoni]
MHTEIRWMSRGKCLERFFALRAEIPVFLEDTIQCDTNAYCAKLRNTDFLLDMAFLADITSHLNHLNMRLQGRCQTVSDLYAHMNAFVTKLTLFKDGFSADRPNLAHFPSCEEMRKDAPECEKTLPKYRADTETLQQQFEALSRFPHHAATHRQSSLTASYAVSLELAKAKKPLSDGEMVKSCAVQMAKAFGDDNMAKNVR